MCNQGLRNRHVLAISADIHPFFVSVERVGEVGIPFATPRRAFGETGGVRDAVDGSGYGDSLARTPADICTPFIPCALVRSEIRRRPRFLGGRPAAGVFDLFLQRQEADGASAFGKLLRLFHLAWAQVALGVPVKLGAVALGVTFGKSDPVLQQGGVRRIRLPFSCRRFGKLQCSTEQVGL